MSRLAAAALSAATLTLGEGHPMVEMLAGWVLDEHRPSTSGITGGQWQTAMNHYVRLIGGTPIAWHNPLT